MNTSIHKTRSQFHRVAVLAVAVAIALAAYALPQAQTPAKKAMTIDDYTKWRSISGQEISADGKWVAYTLQFTNVVAGRVEAGPPPAEPGDERRGDGGGRHRRDLLARLEVGRLPGGPRRPRSAARGRPRRRGRRPAATAGGAPAPVRRRQRGAAGQRGGRARARRRGSSPARRAAQPRDRRRAVVAGHRDVRLLGHIHASVPPAPRRRSAVRRRRPPRRRRRAPGAAAAPVPARPSGAAAAPAAPRGLDAVLLDLRTGRYQLLGSVADIAFNRTGELLAYTVDAAVKDVNGLFVFDTRTGRTTALRQRREELQPARLERRGQRARGAQGQRRREDAREGQRARSPSRTSPAALKDGAAAPTPVVLDPAKADGFPKGWVVSDRAALTWSEDNKRVFFGMKEQVADARHHAQDDRRSGRRGRVEHGRRPGAVAPDDPREPGPQLHLPPGLRRLGEALRQARRRDDAGPRRRARRQVGRRARRARLPPRREEAAGRRLLPRQHLHRRADAHREGPADRPPRLRHLAARHALPLLEGQQVPGLRPRRRRRPGRSAGSAR